MAEQKTFEERFRKSATVYRQKKFIFPIAVGVYGKRDQLFARATVACYEYGGLSIGNFFDYLQYIAQSLALADNILEMKLHDNTLRSLVGNIRTSATTVNWQAALERVGGA
jgi:hypothetical protein